MGCHIYWRLKNPYQHTQQSNSQHGITPQKTWISKNMIIRISNLASTATFKNEKKIKKKSCPSLWQHLTDSKFIHSVSLVKLFHTHWCLRVYHIQLGFCSYLLHDPESETMVLLSQDKLVDMFLTFYFFLFEFLGHLKK